MRHDNWPTCSEVHYLSEYERTNDRSREVGEVIDTGFKDFLRRKGYGAFFESIGVFIYSDVLGTC